MAVYAAPARRRRATRLIAAAALVAGLVIGGAIGRGTAPSVDDQIATGRDGGRQIVASLRVLPLEYEQASAGSSETGLIDDTIARSAQRLPGALNQAPWLTAAQRRGAEAAVRAVRDAARRKLTPERFEAVAARSAAQLEAIFGLPASAPNPADRRRDGREVHSPPR